MKLIYKDGILCYRHTLYNNVVFACIDNRYYIKQDGDYVPHSRAVRGFATVESAVQWYDSHKESITAAINTREFAQDIVRVNSSNVWGYKFNVKRAGDNTGDMLVQFKGPNGGPGDIYIYYDVPIRIYQRWQSAPSKGHYFWVYVRNNFKYSKLTGNRRGVLPNAVN